MSVQEPCTSTEVKEAGVAFGRPLPFEAFNLIKNSGSRQNKGSLAEISQQMSEDDPIKILQI